MERRVPHELEHGPESVVAYQPPEITFLGDLAELTRQGKNPGGADGTTFLGIDIGS